MKIAIAGGTGLIGTKLIQKWTQEGHQIVLLTRNPAKGSTQANVKFVQWDPEKWQIPMQDLEGCDAIVNLAGANIGDKKWDEKQKRIIVDSRLFSTRCLVKACEKLQARPKVFVSASAVGYFGDAGDNVCVEDSPAGKGFLADLCKDWEREAMRVQDLGIRTVIVRMGMILSAQGGALSKMLPIFKKGLGGRIGSGKQWMSWVHIDDACKAIDWLINRDKISGIFNVTAPNPVTNKEFSKTLGSVIKRPTFFPAPAFIVRRVIGEMAEIVLTGQKVLPQKCMRFGFQFSYPNLRAALDNLFTKSSKPTAMTPQ